MYSLSSSLITVVACALVHTSSGAGCVVVAARDALVRVADASVRIEAKRPTRFTNCDRLKVESGQVSACYVTKNGQRTCSDLETGAVLAMAGESDASAADLFGSSLLAIAKGDAKTKFGQTRHLGDVPGMPFGRVLPEANWLIPIPAGSANSIESFSVETIGDPPRNPVVAVVSDGWVRLPTALISGVSYRWRIQNASGAHTGVFRTAQQSDVLRLGPQIDALRATSKSTEGVAMLISELLMDEGFAYSAYLEMVRAGLKEPDN